MNRLKVYGITFFFAAMFVACNKNEEKEPDVFVVGCEYDRQASAKIWKDGVVQNLSASESQTANANSVYVSGTDVYVAGYIGIVAKLWKNGVAQDLTDGMEAHSVFVSGSDVYVAGVGMSVAKLWKNGVTQTLPMVAVNSSVSVFVSKNDVYLTGGDYLLKNGVAQNLSCDESTVFTMTNSVYVVGNDVYVAGYEIRFKDGQYYYCATLWKNGVAQYLTDERTQRVEATSVFVSGRDMYVAGYDYVDYTNIYGTHSVSVAKLWKNGVAQNLSNGNENGFNARANSVYVAGRDIYVAGYEDSGALRKYVAKLWKNGVAQNLTDGNSYAVAMCVFVK